MAKEKALAANTTVSMFDWVNIDALVEAANVNW